MKSWHDYKQTMRAEAPQFRYAREGALADLQAIDWTRSDIDAKNAKGHSALMLAAYHGHTPVVRYLLGCGAHPDSADRGGGTVLMGAAFKGDIEVVRLLVQYGADVAARNAKGQTASDFAHLFGRAEVARFLTQNGREAQPFGMKDIVSAWLSFFSNKRRYAK